MTRRLLILVIALSLPVMVRGGDLSFRTNLVSSLCYEMSVDSRQVGSSSGRVILGERSGVPWYIDIDSTGFVSNIGFRLFSGEARDAIPGEIADFIERYLLELSICKKSLISGKLRDDRVEFLSGRIPDPGKLINPESFMLHHDEEGYSAEWNKGAAQHFMMFFPASYELILGAGQTEIEKTVFLELMKERTSHERALEEGISLVPYEGDILQSRPVETYYIDSLSDIRFFRPDPHGDAAHPVYDSEMPAESIHDLFLLDDFDELDLIITQSLYGFKTVSYPVKLGQWKNFCARNGLKTFIGIESIELGETAKVLLIARNDAVGYNHMLSITMRTDVIDRKAGSIEAVLHAYIPTHNIKNLLGDA